MKDSANEILCDSEQTRKINQHYVCTLKAE